jgi:hypothetical protein
LVGCINEKVVAARPACPLQVSAYSFPLLLFPNMTLTLAAKFAETMQ